jgi:hypothetical protein
MRVSTIRIRRAFRGLAVSTSFALAAAVAGCVGVPSSGGGSSDMTGTAVLALSNVPPDGTCIQIVAAGNRTVTRNFGAGAGATAMFTLNGLPLGQVTFTASAFAGSCPPPAGAVPNWISDAAFTATIGVSPPALVTLNLVRNGSATVSVGFDDGPDGGAASSDAGGATTGGGGSAGSAGGSAVAELMQVAGVTGEVSAASPFTSAFHIDNFTLDAKTPSSLATGSGAGTGKTVWAASATFRPQGGLADLTKDAAQGKAIPSVVIGKFASGALFYKVTLTNVLISSITAASGPGDSMLAETVSFGFASITIEIEGTQNPDGSIGAATAATFNLLTNTGPSIATLPPLELVFGGPATPPAEAVSAFIAPSETSTTSATNGGGAGAGKTTFGDASVTFPFDLTALDVLISQVDGKVAPSAEVQLETPGAASSVGTYGFQNVEFHETTLSDANATISFGAQSFSWTFGGVTTTAP